MNSIIELEHIKFTYPNSEKGLQDVSLSVAEGQKTAVLGLNGAGKSTLFLLLCGVLRPERGIYRLEGKPFGYTKKERSQVGKRIGYVFQDPEVQLFATSVYDDIAFGVRNMGVPEQEVKKIVEDYLAFLQISDLRDVAPHELSYGQKKLVAIAGVLAMNPKVLILDEPFAWLDVVQVENMKTLLQKLEQKGISILLSTHNLEYASSWANNALILKDGKCVHSGKIPLQEELKQLL